MSTDQYGRQKRANVARVRQICVFSGLATCIMMYAILSWNSGPVSSYKLRYTVGFWLVEMAISTNQKPTIYRNLYENTDPETPDVHEPSCTRLRVYLCIYKHTDIFKLDCLNSEFSARRGVLHIYITFIYNTKRTIQYKTSTTIQRTGKCYVKETQFNFHLIKKIGCCHLNILECIIIFFEWCWKTEYFFVMINLQIQKVRF